MTKVKTLFSLYFNNKPLHNGDNYKAINCLDYKNDSDTVMKIEAVEAFISRSSRFLALLSLENLENGTAFSIDICELLSDQIFLDKWIDFKKHIFENPLHTLNCFKLAIHQVFYRDNFHLFLLSMSSKLNDLLSENFKYDTTRKLKFCKYCKYTIYY